MLIQTLQCSYFIFISTPQSEVVELSLRLLTGSHNRVGWGVCAPENKVRIFVYKFSYYVARITEIRVDQSLLRCIMGIYDILRYFLDRKPDTYYSSPDAKLKWLIDNDPKCDSSVEQLSRQYKYSKDHLRIVFKKHYGLSPLQYRNRKRTTHAMELIIGQF